MFEWLLDPRHRADFWRLRASVRTRALPYHEDTKRMLYVAEDDPEKFFGRPPTQLEATDLLRWEIAVEALCQITGERPVIGMLPTRTADEENVI